MDINEGKTEDNSRMSFGTRQARVNINTLIARYKKERAKERTETLIFVSLATVLVIISGIIISL